MSRFNRTHVLVGITLLLGACESRRHTGSKGASEPEERTAQVTVWGAHHELFIEHRLLVAQTPMTFVTHVTELESLEPRRSGSVVYTLRQGTEQPIELTDPAPARDGIYTPKLTFPRAGEWNVTIRLSTGKGDSVVALPPVHVFASKEEAQKAPETETPEGVSFLKEQQWKVLTKTEPVRKHTLKDRIKLAGRVLAVPGNRAAVTPPVGGRLLAMPGKGVPTIGEHVEAGQVLALVQPPFSDFAVRITEAEAAVIRTKLAVDQAELLLDRTRKLAAEQAKSQKELMDAEFSLKSARAAYDAALSIKGAFERSGAVFVRTSDSSGLPALALTAPISGVITEIEAPVGAHVPPDRSVFTILDTDTVYIEGKIPEADTSRIASSCAAVYERTNAKGIFIPILGDGGRFVFLGREIDEKTRTLSVVYQVRNSDGRLPIGLAVDLFIETARVEEALAIPESAIVETDGRSVAFVQVSGETFAERPLKLGFRDAGLVQVLSGLAVGERVVTKEAYAIRLASVSTAIPAHGHAH